MKSVKIYKINFLKDEISKSVRRKYHIYYGSPVNFSLDRSFDIGGR